MARGVKNGEGFFVEVKRQRTYRRIRGVETYRLRFTYAEGGAYINVNFEGEHEHDAIGVFDYAKGESIIKTRQDVKAHVNEYMAGMTADDLRAHWENRPRH